MPEQNQCVSRLYNNLSRYVMRILTNMGASIMLWHWPR